MLAPELSNSLAPYRRHAVMAGLLRGAAVLFPAVGLGCVLAVWAPTTGLLVPAIMVLGGLGALGVVATSVWFRARAPLRLASQVEQLLPELGDGVRAAVGLSQDGGHAGMSVALTHALVRDVSTRLRSDGLRQRHWRALVRRLRPVLALAAAGVVLAAVPAAVARDRLMTGLARAWTWPKAGAVGRGAALPPLWSDVTLTLRYPAYTRRPPATLEGVSGDFTAPKGAEVVLRARPDADYSTHFFRRTWDIDVPEYATPTTDAARNAIEEFEDDVIDRLFALNSQRGEEERVLGVGTEKVRGKRKPHVQGGHCSEVVVGAPPQKTRRSHS